MSYTNLLHHTVYATKERAPLITTTLRPRLHEYLGGTVRGLGGIAIEVNGVADHVHILAKLRPTISISEFLSKLKSGGRRVGLSGKSQDDLAARLDLPLSPLANLKSSACDVTFVIRKSIIELNRSRKNLRLCCKHTTLISMQLIYGVDSIASFAGLVGFPRRCPQARLRLARGFILPPANAG